MSKTNDFTTRLLGAALGAVTLAVAALPAGSATAGLPTTGLDACRTGTACLFEMGGMPVSISADDQVIRDGDGTIRLIGSIELPTPAGTIDLVEAEMVFTPTEYGHEFVRGVTRVPFPSQWFGDVAASEVPMAEFGMQDGAELAHLGAHLNPGRNYLYFRFSTGLTLDLPWPDEPWAMVLPQSIPFDAGYTATIVLDPTDPYLYIGGPCPSATPRAEEHADRDDTAGGRQAGAEDGNGEQVRGRGDDPNDEGPDSDTGSSGSQFDTEVPRDERSDDQPADHGTDEQPADTESEQDDDEPTGIAIVEPGDDSAAQDCGIGFSWGGNIPAPATLDQPAFGGHVVVDAPVPLGAFVELDGTSVYEIDLERGVRVVGYGDLAAGVPFAGDLLSLEFPVGHAGITVEASTDRIGYAFEGVLETEDRYEIAMNGLQFGLPGEGRTRIATSFGVEHTTDGWTVDRDGFFEASGEIAVGPRSWGDALGVALNDVAAADARLRVDRNALTLSGGMSGQLHPSVATDAGARLDVRADFADASASYLRATGSMRVAGTALGAGSIEVGRSGVFVEGMLTNTITTVAMSGQITDTGAELAGRTSVDVPLAAIGRAARDTVAAAEQAQADVDRLTVEIERTRDQIIDERRRTSDDLRLAQVSVDRAEDDVASLTASIALNNGKISYLNQRMSVERSRYRRLGWFDRLRQSGLHAGRIGSYSAAVAGLRTANAGLAAARLTARAALDAARAALTEVDRGLQAIPVEADPRMAGLITAHATATATLSATKAAAAPFTGLDGSPRAEATFHLTDDGASGRLAAEWCTDAGCVPLQHGRLDRIDGRWRACISTGATATNNSSTEVCAWV